MRKTILIISCIAIGFLVGCGVNTKAGHDKEIAITEDNGDISKTVYVLTDRVTGVQYIATHIGYGTAITPRYNADGTLYTGE